MKGLIFINKDEIQLDVAMKNAALFIIPSGNTAHANVAIKARCSSVNMPAKFINKRFL
jgi:fibrillarin-like rRNA methylase